MADEPTGGLQAGGAAALSGTAPPAPGVVSPQPTTANTSDRPAYVPEAFWDADKKSVKLEELAGKFGELTAAQKAEADRRAALPKTSAEYAFAMPEGFKLPEGAEIDPKAPMWGKLQEMAHAQGWSPETFSKLGALGIEAQMEFANKFNHAQSERVAAESAKLGDNHLARVEAVHRFMDANFGDAAKDVKAALVNAASVVAFEKMITALQSSGVAALNGAGRDTGPKPGEIPGYDKMTFTQKWNAAKAASAANKAA